MESNNSVLVTGGSGFIGSHLVDFLVEKKYNVKVIDNLSSGRAENIQHHLDISAIDFHKIDLSDFNESEKIESIVNGCKWVFHLAALADIVPSIQNPIKYHKSNVDGTINILEASRKNNIEKFIYTASSSCYGIAEKYPTPENAPINPEYPYALTKYLGEQCAFHWNKLYNLPVISLRLFNVYGSRSRTTGTYGAVFGVFLAQKIHNKPFTVVGDGTQTRDFTFVSDIVKGFHQAAESNILKEIINLGSGNTYSVNRLTELLGGEVVHIPKRPGEPDCTFADITKAQKLLNYKPQVSFEEGVKIMLDHIEDWNNAPIWTPEKIDKATKDWFQYLSK
jgi:UDP-glucose 4-epimerase